MQIRVAHGSPANDTKLFRATATNLNRYGALVSIESEVKIGAKLMLINPKEEHALARVVAEARSHNSLRNYGVEFLDCDAGASFWGLTFVGQENT